MVTKRNVLFDLIRGVSALVVMFSHLRNTMFIDYSELKGTGNISTKIFYFFTGLGHQAVMIFFVLSGFFVGGAVINKRRIFKFSDYLLSRLTRLWVVLIPALIFTLGLDLLVDFLSPDIIEGTYLKILNSGPKESYSLSIKTFIANIFFFQTIYTPVYGSNSPLWSLANEFWYYILFPLMFIVLKNKSTYNFYIRVLSFFLLIGFSIMIYDKLEGYLIWLMGVLVFALYQSNIKIRNKSISNLIILFSMILFLISIVVSKKDYFAGVSLISNDLFIGVCFSIFIFSIKDSSFFIIENKYLSKFSIWLSNISFTLYVIHFPLLMLIFALFYKDNMQVLSLNSFIEFSTISIVLIVFSYFFWYLFERNTDKVKKYIKQKITK
ncbi:acyltransferase family protein [Polaribacter sp. Asnod1-A03]|uniref:acyltransferase family protein n=1 Tax=Polaribacter sp. Asnod1-A03 TaxID=3160581 RepID=UPI00386B6449